MITWSPMPYRHRQHGFSLIEVLIAVVVLAVGLLGLAALQSVSLKMQQSSILRTQATALATGITDAIRANKNNAVDYDGTFSTTCEPKLKYDWTSGVAAGDLSIWENRIACLLPSGTGEVEVSGSTVTVTVTWNEDRLGDSTQSFSTTTEI